METEGTRHQQLIESAMSRDVGETHEVALRLWESLASELISIIGRGGFVSLYDRSLYLVSAVIPWLSGSEPSNTVEGRFSALAAALAQADKTEAGIASRQLFQTFIDLLASLIGDTLTIDILRSAWRIDTTTFGIATKEFPHE